MIEFAPLETNRFGINCYRYQTNNPINIDLLREELDKKKVDLLILRADVNLIEELHLFNQLPAYQTIFADALVYYQAKLNITSQLQLRNTNLNFVLVEPTHKQLLNELVPVIFANYRNHYFANPHLPKNKITEGYQEWATGYINHFDQQKISWLVYKNNIPVGFATCSMNANDRSCEGVLYGVHPNHSGGGIYADIIRFTKHYFASMQYQNMWVSTQLQNIAVQKVWQREGFEINHAYYTFHLIRKQW